MEYTDLIWNEEKKRWICNGCDAEYYYPQNSKPRPSYCMKCKIEWLKGE